MVDHVGTPRAIESTKNLTESLSHWSQPSSHPIRMRTNELHCAVRQKMGKKRSRPLSSSHERATECPVCAANELPRIR